MRATWAPRGHTPVLRHHFHWKRLSMSAAIAYAHDRANARIVFHTRPGAYNDQSLIEFLHALHDELDTTKVTLIWDGLPSHHSRRMQGWIRGQRRWLVVERLPGYAPGASSAESAVGRRHLARGCRRPRPASPSSSPPDAPTARSRRRSI